MQRSGSSRNGSSKVTHDLRECFMCGLKFALMLATEREAHINECLERKASSQDPSSSPSSNAYKTPAKSTNKDEYRCPHCRKDLTGYSPTRRGSHVNRCITESESFDGVQMDGIESMRSGLEMENGDRRRKPASKISAPDLELPPERPPNVPPPRSMNMNDLEYDCVICDKRLPSDFGQRYSHVNSCTQKHDIAVEELGRLTEARNARLAQEREAWDLEHSDFRSSQEEAALEAAKQALADNGREAPKRRKKSSAAVIGAHLDHLEADSALKHFFPSQQLDSQNTSTDSHNLTWASGESPPKRVGIESSRDPSSPTTSPAASPPRPLRVKKTGFSNHASSPIVLDSPQPVRSSLVALEVVPLWSESTVSDDLLDSSLSVPSHSRPPKRLSNDAIDDWYPSDVKRPKAHSNPQPLSSSQSAHVINLDSPSITPSASQNGQDETPASSQDDTIIKFRKPLEEPMSKPISSSRANSGHLKEIELNSEEYYALPLEERLIVRAEASAKAKSSSSAAAERTDKSASSRPKPFEEDDAELLAPLDRPATPPLPMPPNNFEPSRPTRRTSAMVDLLSPERPPPQRRVDAPSASHTSHVRQRDEIAPRAPIVADRVALPQSSTTAPLSTSSNRTSFETELDGIILRFHKIEQQARETYFQTLAQSSKNRTHAVLRLATNYSIDVQTAMTTMALRTANLPSNASNDPFSSSTDVSIDLDAVNTSTHNVNAAPSNPPPRSRTAPEVTHMNGHSNGNSVSDTHRSARPSEPAEEEVERRPKVSASSRPTSSLSTASATNDAPLPTSNSSSSLPQMASASSAPTTSNEDHGTSPQRPDFEGMSNAELVEEAKKYSLSSSISRAMLVTQLQAMWRFHQSAPVSSVSTSRPSAQPHQVPHQLSAAERIEAFANPNRTATPPVPSTTIASTTAAQAAEPSANPPTVAKRSRAKSTKATAAAKAAASAQLTSAPTVDSPRSSDSDGGAPTTNANAANATASAADVAVPAGATLHEKLDNFIRTDIDLYASILHYTSIDIVELQAKLKRAKIKASRSELQNYLQVKSVLCHIKKVKSTAAKSSTAAAAH